MPEEPMTSVDSWTPEDTPIYFFEPLTLGTDASGYGGDTPHAVLVSELLEQASDVETPQPSDGSTCG